MSFSISKTKKDRGEEEESRSGPIEDFRFYFGVASGSTVKALRQLEEPNVMINYATKNNRPFDTIKNLFVDSGGYSFIKGKGEYTTTNEEYVEYLVNHQPEVFALRDYPCEPDVLEEHSRTVKDHQEMTIERHRQLLDTIQDRDLKGEVVSVLQGWELDDYIRHIDMMKEAGTLTDYVGIGSVCRRGMDEEIMEIIRTVRNELPSSTKIHAFGVKSNILRFPSAVRMIDSADSQAYEYSERYTRRVSGTKRKSFRDSALSYLQFKRKLNCILVDGEYSEPDSNYKV